MLERRKIDRSRTFFGGLVAYNRRRSTLDCLVRNFSADGAKLAFSNMGTLPDKFDLMIGRKERSYRARVAWQGTNEVGVAFLPDDAGAETIPLEWAKRLRDCEVEKAALQRRVDQLSTD
jgi:hypothetical protein